MDVIRKFSRGVIFAVLLTGTIGFWITGSAAAETKTKTTTQQKLPVTQSFLPCHPPRADMSPDGKFFIHIIQDQPMLGILEMGAEQKNSQIQLPKKAYDAVFVDNTRIVVSYGPWGELVVIDTKQTTVGDSLQVGASAEGMCRVAGGRVVVLDSKGNSIHLVDPNAKAMVKTRPVQPNAAQMRWAVPDLELEVADTQGKFLGKIELPR